MGRERVERKRIMSALALSDAFLLLIQPTALFAFLLIADFQLM